jgi:hypothetical protein
MASAQKKRGKGGGKEKKEKKEEDGVPTYHLKVLVDSAANLPVADRNGTSDPYVCLALEGSKDKQITKVVENNCINPRWRQELWLKDTGSPASDRLKITVFDKDKKQDTKKNPIIAVHAVWVHDIPYGVEHKMTLGLDKCDRKGKVTPGSQQGDAGTLKIVVWVYEAGQSTDSARARSCYEGQIEFVSASLPAEGDVRQRQVFLVASLTKNLNSQKWTSKTIKGTLTPAWNEKTHFFFGESRKDPIEVVLWNKNDPDDEQLGQTSISLKDFKPGHDLLEKVYEIKRAPQYASATGMQLTVRAKVIQIKAGPSPREPQLAPNPGSNQLFATTTLSSPQVPMLKKKRGVKSSSSDSGNHRDHGKKSHKRRRTAGGVLQANEPAKVQDPPTIEKPPKQDEKSKKKQKAKEPAVVMADEGDRRCGLAADPCPFSWGNYGSGYSTNFTGYSKKGSSLQVGSSEDETHHNHPVGLSKKKVEAIHKLSGTILKAEGLAIKEVAKTGAFAIVQIVDAQGKEKTDTQKSPVRTGTVAPVWDFGFDFGTVQSDWTLRLIVLQTQDRGEASLGEASLKIQDIELNSTDPVELTLDKPPKSKPLKSGKTWGKIFLTLNHALK